MNRKALVLSSLLLVISLLSVAIMPAVPVSACEGDPCEEPPPCEKGKPSIDVTKTVCATSSGAEGVISITNSSEVMVTVLTITDTVEWKGKGSGGWQPVPNASINVPPPAAQIAPGATVDIDYAISFSTPSDAKALRNVVEVTIAGRDKVFKYIESF